MRSIEDKIICKYAADCNRYSINGDNSVCPHCRRNEYKDIMMWKEDYYQPTMASVIFDAIGIMIIISACLQYVYYILT